MWKFAVSRSGRRVRPRSGSLSRFRSCPALRSSIPSVPAGRSYSFSLKGGRSGWGALAGNSLRRSEKRRGCRPPPARAPRAGATGCPLSSPLRGEERLGWLRGTIFQPAPQCAKQLLVAAKPMRAHADVSAGSMPTDLTHSMTEPSQRRAPPASPMRASPI